MANTAENEYTRPTMADTPTSPASSSESSQAQERVKVYSLVKHLVDDVALLFRKELALAASEVGRSVKDTKKGMTGLLSGAVVLNSGYLFLLGAAALGLAQVMDAWMAVLLVGAVTTVVGLLMVQGGKKKLEPSSFKPERTIDEIRKNKDSVKGTTS
ncbi:MULTISPECIES: phage holin family protein [Marinobacter]|uniref:phage holin family protein n=1 Tax=Marinobacter TaxID=2742 RepID=UPI001247E0CB|nr:MULTISPECIES: phage holin family protein [Marinobacter]MBL3555264.1 phage holin family protein [Marinobacter sp. JB05H06]